MSMEYAKNFYPEAKLTGFTYVDGTIAFYNTINFLIHNKSKEDITVLDLGCGRAAFSHELHSNAHRYRAELRNFKGKVNKVIGLDVDINAKDNPTIDEFHLIDVHKPWPVADESIDLIICDYVVEHVDNVEFFFNEVQRVVKKGGWICIRTVNSNGYISLAAKLVPNKYHSKVLSNVQDNRKEEDVFPTVYKCNTRSRLRKTLQEIGFDAHVYTHESEPSYLSFSKLFYFIGVAYQKLAPAYFKNILFAFGQKK